MKLYLIATVCLIPFVSAFSQSIPQGTRVFHDLAYVDNGHERQKLDLYLPAGGRDWPLIIMVHGGAFRMGDKRGENVAPFLAQGYAVASVNYRLSGHAIWPAQAEDVKAAVRWLRASAGKYGYDPDRFGAFGASAGGHLVSILGTTADTTAFDTDTHPGVSSRVQAVVDYFGPTDFLQMDAHRLPDGQLHDPADSPESELVGGPIRERQDRVRSANPITYVTTGDSPFLIVHGDRDPLVPHHQSVLLEEALHKSGVEVYFYTVKGGGHGFNDPEAERLRMSFFERHLKRR